MSKQQDVLVALDEGSLAYQNGQSADTNPYEQGTECFLFWNQGFYDAELYDDIQAMKMQKELHDGEMDK